MEIVGQESKEERKTDFKDYEHRRQVTNMLKIISMCPMDEHIKMVMRCRIWGVDSKVFRPLESHQIAFLDTPFHSRVPTQKEIEYIEALEKSGIFACEQFLISQNAQETIDKFNIDFTKHKGQMFPKMPFEQKRFNV